MPLPPWATTSQLIRGSLLTAPLVHISTCCSCVITAFVCLASKSHARWVHRTCSSISSSVTYYRTSYLRIGVPKMDQVSLTKSFLMLQFQNASCSLYLPLRLRRCSMDVPNIYRLSFTSGNHENTQWILGYEDQDRPDLCQSSSNQRGGWLPADTRATDSSQSWSHQKIQVATATVTAVQTWLWVQLNYFSLMQNRPPPIPILDQGGQLCYWLRSHAGSDDIQRLGLHFHNSR